MYDQQMWRYRDNIDFVSQSKRMFRDDLEERSRLELSGRINSDFTFTESLIQAQMILDTFAMELVVHRFPW